MNRSGIQGVARSLTFAAVALTLLLQGCATTSRSSAPVPQDPFESWNRGVFAFNEGLDVHVIKPVATGYAYVLPSFVRTGVTNFFANFTDLWSGINSVLQGKLSNGGSDGLRVVTNTTIGIAGLFDVATGLGIKKYPEDFGQTLGVWGFGAGPYVVWPVLGGSSVRDSVGLPLDIAATPGFWVDDSG
jgi:phospholipid-binding lipoprotein MlaA